MSHTSASPPTRSAAKHKSVGDNTRSRLEAAWRHPAGRRAVDTVLPAYFFAMVVLAKGMGLAQTFQDLPSRIAERGAWPVAAWLLHQSLTLVFLSLVVVLFVIRRPVVGSRTGARGALVALGGTFVLALLNTGGAEPTSWSLLAVSAGLILVGTLVSIISLFTLRECFGIFPEARGLVTRGPYRWIRHPVYLGELISGLGVVLPVLSAPNAVVFGLFCWLQYWRALHEERALAAAIPEYAAYRARTWRLVPWLH